MNNLFALIVDDHPDSATIFAEALKAVGFETEVILSGDVALERLAATTPDMVVLDLSLPRVAGTDILHHIRTEPRLAKTRVIVVTAHPQLAESAREEADALLIKPVSFGQLREVAASLVPTASSKS